MEITFADGTRIEVAASALDEFVRHDLKWVEFVHGRASQTLSALQGKIQGGKIISPSVKRCPPPSLGC